MAKQLYTIHDGSWSLVDKGGEKMETISGIHLKGRQFRLLAQGCDLPAYDKGFESEGIRNNAVLREVGTGEVIFTKMQFIKPIATICPVCGELIFK